MNESELSRVDAALAAMLPLDLPPYGLRSRRATGGVSAGALAINAEGKLEFHCELRAPEYLADDDAPTSDWEEGVVRLANERYALTPPRAEALATGWMTVLGEALRSAARVPNKHRPSVGWHKLCPGSTSAHPFARVAPTTAAFAHEFRGPELLGTLMRIDPASAQPAVQRVADVLAAVLPVDAGGLRLELVDPPVHAKAQHIHATLALVNHASGDVMAQNVPILAAWALDDLDRAEAAIRAQAVVLSEIFAHAPETIEGLTPHELFDVADLLAARGPNKVDFAAVRRKLWRSMLPAAPKAAKARK